LQTLFESAGLALISSRHIHGARPVLFANVVQVPKVKKMVVVIKVIVEHVAVLTSVIVLTNVVVLTNAVVLKDVVDVSSIVDVTNGFFLILVVVKIKFIFYCFILFCVLINRCVIFLQYLPGG
jgi:hypothetical protein